MTIRWTEEEYAKHQAQTKAALRSRDTRKVSPPKRTPERREVKREDDAREENQRLVRIEVVSIRRQHCDPDNLVPKWWLDCIVEKGVIPDDSSKYISSIVKRVVVSKDIPEMTLIRIWED